MSAFCVAESSGKDRVSPRERPHATASICSPIQANGRKETYRSFAAIGSIALAVLVGVFMLYLRPDLVFALAAQVWNCF
jgi:hypothetical protein